MDIREFSHAIPDLVVNVPGIGDIDISKVDEISFVMHENEASIFKFVFSYSILRNDGTLSNSMSKISISK